MEQYRLFNRLTMEFRDVKAASPLAACISVHWLIGNTWVRRYTRGRFANGWAGCTPRLSPIQPEQASFPFAQGNT